KHVSMFTCSRDRGVLTLCLSTGPQVSALTPSPTLLVSNSSIRPAPRHSSSTQSNLSPYRFFHFLVLAASTSENCPRDCFAVEIRLSESTAPSHRSRRRYKGASRYLVFPRRSSRYARPAPRSRRYGPMFGTDMVIAEPGLHGGSARGAKPTPPKFS